MLGWFQALMPKEGRFFALFEKHAGIVVAGAEALRGLLQGGDTVEAYCQQIFQREAEADDVTREALVAVRRTFITPFERPDIQDLITSLDDAIDQMNKTPLSRPHRSVLSAAIATDLYSEGGWQKRPLGIAALGDKIVQAAVVAILTPIYEAEFLGFSYGF